MKPTIPLITKIIVVLAMSGCTSLPFGGKYLERALHEEPKTQIRASAEGDACRCEAVCAGSS